jgi:hypothetical protein
MARDATTWKIQGELRRFERRPFRGRPYQLPDEGPSLETSNFTLNFSVI